MATILINKVKYKGEKYIYETPILTSGLNIIEGSNGKGKSTLFDLIYFGLSGKVDAFNANSKSPHNEIVNDKQNYVELDIVLNNKRYVLRRYITSNDITVTDINGISDVYTIYRNAEGKVFSDWILDELNISVVEIIQGLRKQKINIKDLLRLIYHDQQANPENIYKPAENEGNFVSDSLLVRKTIFQLLLGETFSKYYDELAKLKLAENEKNIAKIALDEYTNISKSLSENDEDMNAEFIKQELIKQKKHLKRLIFQRDSIQITRPTSAETNINDIEIIKQKLYSTETELINLSTKEQDLVTEIIKYKRLFDTQILEVTQLKKIIHSHEKLNLFTPNTCPYCLKPVERKDGHCVCGSEISEIQYEKFFYDSSEYAKILKSKQKTVQTIQRTIDILENDLSEISKKKNELENKNTSYKEEISNLLKSIDTSYQNNQLDKIDDEILYTKERIEKLKKKYSVELKLIELQEEFESKQKKYKTINNNAKKLELEAEVEIEQKLGKFNTIYNSLMVKTLQNCRTAKLDSDDYLPIINNGEYREVSSRVSIRLNYFLTFLKLSIEESDVVFPRFLLIDTPKTGGIDKDNLNMVLSNIDELLESNKDDFQIILSTGIEEYPSNYKEYVFETLTERNRLLKPINKIN